MGRPPTQEEMTRSLEDLRHAADEWTACGAWLASNSSKFDGHIARGMSFGLYVLIGMTYEKACHRLAQAAHDGGAKLQQVGSTLRKVHDAYRDDEQNNVHRAQGRW